MVLSNIWLVTHDSNKLPHALALCYSFRASADPIELQLPIGSNSCELTLELFPIPFFWKKPLV